MRAAIIVGASQLGDPLWPCYPVSVLVYLSVEDLAVIRQLRLEPGPGLNVLSGETGAGKSLLVQALSLLVGARAEKDIVRTGCRRAVVEALFDLSAAPGTRQRLEQAGFEECDELAVRRVVAIGGRSSVFLNGSPATVGMLREVMTGLVDVTAQHESISLLRDSGSTEALDLYAGLEHARAALRSAWERRVEASKRVEALASEARERQGRLEYLSYQLREIDELELEDHEDDSLRVERERLHHAGRLTTVASQGEATLYSGDGSAYDRLHRVMDALSDLAGVDPDLEAVLASLEVSRVQIEDASMWLSRYASRIEADPSRLEQLEDRLAGISDVLRKHQLLDVTSLLAHREEMAEEYQLLQRFDEQASEAEGVFRSADEECQEWARELSKGRAAAARALGTEVVEGLGSLGMPDARFEVCLEAADLGVTGAERVVFRFGPNPGEEAQPLARVASGGELSRALLAIKVALAAADAVPVQVFDEVDAEVGGHVAEMVGRQLRGLVDGHQVLVITHQAQVAAYGDCHFQITKAEEKGRTETYLERLEGAAREDEIARMLAGREISTEARELARSLLQRGLGLIAVLASTHGVW